MKPLFLFISLSVLLVGCGEDNSALEPHVPAPVAPAISEGTTLKEDCVNYCKEEDQFKACLQNPFGMCMPPTRPFLCGDCK